MATLLSSIVTSIRIRIQETLVLITPGAPLVSPQGTVGATTYSYKVVATNSLGHSIASSAGTTTTGNAALSGVNFNQLTWTQVPRATGYKIYRTVGGATQGLIATLGDVATTNDTGLVGDGSSAPTDNTSGDSQFFWSDDELLEYAILGCKDLWRSFLDLHQDHFFVDDETNVSLAANASQLTGVPSNCFRILLIEPRDTTDAASSRLVKFKPAKVNDPEFIKARSLSAQDPSQPLVIYYRMTVAGPPVGTVVVKTAPKIDTALLIRLIYLPSLSSTLAATDANPIPGESDKAVIAYATAEALAKDRDDRMPDPNWLAVYKTEKDSCLIAAAPRQEQEPPVVKGVFDDMFGPGLSGDLDFAD